MRRSSAGGTAALLLGLAACIGATGIPQRQIQTQPALTAASFVRSIAPFDVRDAGGERYTLPFLGGLNVPRPQFADIDADGDLDLFLQEYSNSLMYFENVGSASSPRFELRSDRYQDLDIGDWFRLVDIDADGDLDLVAEQPYSFVRYYRNVGGPSTPRFQYADSLRDGDGAALYIDRQNIPAFVDLDCDGRMDLFVGRVEGTVTHYEANDRGAERFTFQQDRFEEIEIIGQVDTTGTLRHGANALAFADFDGDGDWDLFWGDYFEKGVLLIENRGRTCSTPALSTDPVLLPHAAMVRTSGYNVPVPVDLDLDGDVDFLMGVLGGAYNPASSGADNFYYWERTGAGALELRTRRFLSGIDVGSDAVPAVGDIDGDGDLDILVGGKIDPHSASEGAIYVFTNEGSARAPSFRLTDTLRLASAYHLAPALGDLDGDGDLDLLLGTWNEDVLLFRNEGDARGYRFVQDTAATIRPPRASNTVPALADVDNDGDLDLFVGGANGEISYYRNEGNARAMRFTLVSESLDGIDAGRRSAPALVDIDGDGKLDLVLGREEPGLSVFRNTGSFEQPRFSPMPGFLIALPPLSAPLFVDLDGDGNLDLLAGSGGGGLLFFAGRDG